MPQILNNIQQQFDTAANWQEQYPWFPLGQLVAANLQKNTAGYQAQTQKAAIFFNDIHQFHWLLCQSEIDTQAILQQYQVSQIPNVATNLTEPLADSDKMVAPHPAAPTVENAAETDLLIETEVASELASHAVATATLPTIPILETSPHPITTIAEAHAETATPPITIDITDTTLPETRFSTSPNAAEAVPEVENIANIAVPTIDRLPAITHTPIDAATVAMEPSSHELLAINTTKEDAESTIEEQLNTQTNVSAPTTFNSTPVTIPALPEVVPEETKAEAEKQPLLAEEDNYDPDDTDGPEDVTNKEPELTSILDVTNETFESTTISQSLAEVSKHFKEDAVTEELDISTEAYHTVDYFASQGIKLELEPKADDKFGQQLKSFTSWLKQMKRLPVTKMSDKAHDPSVENIASTSLEQGEVVTESMAEVLVKQGKQEQAIEVWQKLSLLHPEKSHYFANLIEKTKV